MLIISGAIGLYIQLNSMHGGERVNGNSWLIDASCTDVVGTRED